MGEDFALCGRRVGELARRVKVLNLLDLALTVFWRAKRWAKVVWLGLPG